MFVLKLSGKQKLLGGNEQKKLKFTYFEKKYLSFHKRSDKTAANCSNSN